MHYLNTGNIFSKSFLIKENLKNSLIITKNENIKKYLNIFSYLNSKITEITCLSQFIDCVYNENGNFIVNYDLFFAKIPTFWEIENKFSFNIEKNKTYKIEELVKKLNDFGYKFNDFLEGGDYKKVGDSIILKQKNKNETITISFWGDQVESIFRTIGSEIQQLQNIYIGKNLEINYFLLNDKFNIDLIKILKDKNIILDSIDILDGGQNFLELENKISLDILKNPNISQINLDISDLYVDGIDEFIKILRDGNTTKKIFTKNSKTIQNFLDYNNIFDIEIQKTDLNILKSYKNSKNIVICDDILSKIFVKKRLKRSVSENIDMLLQIKPGDFVVHIDHGIGVFKQIIEKQIPSISGKDKFIKKEFIEIEYKNNDKLFVPITEIKRISKYVGTENPSLTGLSTKEWSKKLDKVSQDVEKTAKELLEIYAKRKLQLGFSFVLDKEKIEIFQRSFDFDYTPDQLNAISEIFQDMQNPNPMERILVGDVGFGKTEVAFNAIYNAFLNKKQSIIISPLVVLAYEHYSKAIDRFGKFGLNVEVLTRFESLSKAKIILEKLKSGKIDLIIGTHRLLSENIIYKDLGLLIIDEEHKFGVKDKEKIKELKSGNKIGIDILSMSATPIPRSLHMALNGVREASILSKAPSMRKGIETYVSKFEDNIILQAGKKEFERGGALFFIHNRVETIESMGKYLQELFPHKSVIITHGQLAGHELEDRILAFKRGEYDILLSSTVIENGIDFPNVNTIIINDAYNFGISQIHQLRGRVGRSDQVGYCYLLFKKEKITTEAAKRLQTIVEYSHLGAGFELAIKDLEIRGSGDILGIRQSGKSTEVGISVYLKMLEEKISQLKSLNQTQKDNNLEIKKVDTTIDLNIGAYLSDEFFTSELDKINFYREIENISDYEELNELVSDFQEINPNLTKENKNLFQILKVRILASNYKIKSIIRDGVSYLITFLENISIEELKNFLDLDTKVVFVVNDLNKLKVSTLKFENDEEFLNYIENIMEIKNKVIRIKSDKLTKNNY